MLPLRGGQAQEQRPRRARCMRERAHRPPRAGGRARRCVIEATVNRKASTRLLRVAATTHRSAGRLLRLQTDSDLGPTTGIARDCFRTEAVTSCGLFEGATRCRSWCSAAAGAALAGSASSRLSANALTVARPRMAGSTPVSLSRRTRFDTATWLSWRRCVGPAERKQGRAVMVRSRMAFARPVVCRDAEAGGRERPVLVDLSEATVLLGVRLAGGSRHRAARL